MAKLLIQCLSYVEQCARFEPGGIAESAVPAKLVELTLEHDRVLIY
jgi:hypothetical protein